MFFKCYLNVLKCPDALWAIKKMRESWSSEWLWCRTHVYIRVQVLYDEDIVEEEQLTEWFDRKGPSRQLAIDDNAATAVRKAALPFITWLREAEAESEGDE